MTVMSTDHPEPAHEMHPLKRWIFRLFLVVFALGLLALAEGLARRLYDRITPESGRAAVANLMGDDSTLQSGYFLQHPYLFYTYRPFYEAFRCRQFNARGHRGEVEVSQKPDKGVLRIMAVGGSTTVSFPYAPDPAMTWPAQLERMLRERTGLQIEVINAGLHDANSADLLLHYFFRNRYLEPDIVVMHAGGNDGVALLFDNYNPEYTHYTHGWRNTSLAPRPYERALLRCRLLRVLYAWWLKDISLASVIGRDDIKSLTPERCLANAQAQEPEGFRRNMDLFVRAVIEDNAVPVIFPFVWAPEDIMQKASGYGAYYKALACGFRKDRQVMEEIARLHSLPIVNIPDNAIDRAMFVDFCHVNEEGEAVKARCVADVLIPVINRLNTDNRFKKIASGR